MFLSTKHRERERMGVIRKEKGVLKLVHPGRYVEIHRESITAAEVIRRNPRHCITRPDVFEFPWIVVNPESVLLPGRVFFIVPNHTIYNLIKARGPSSQKQSPINHLLHDLKQAFLGRYSAETSPKHQTHKQSIDIQLPKKMSPHVESQSKYDWDKTPQKQSQVELWPKVIRYKDTQTRIEQQLQEKFTSETRPCDAIEYQKSCKDYETELLKKDVNLEFVSNEQVSMLKSCFRKPDSIRKSLNLKVSFDLPIKTEEKQRKFTEVLQNFLAGDGETSI